jgi:hypothetical protein
VNVADRVFSHLRQVLVDDRQQPETDQQHEQALRHFEHRDELPPSGERTVDRWGGVPQSRDCGRWRRVRQAERRAWKATVALALS